MIINIRWTPKKSPKSFTRIHPKKLITNTRGIQTWMRRMTADQRQKLWKETSQNWQIPTIGPWTTSISLSNMKQRQTIFKDLLLFNPWLLLGLSPIHQMKWISIKTNPIILDQNNSIWILPSILASLAFPLGRKMHLFKKKTLKSLKMYQKTENFKVKMDGTIHFLQIFQKKIPQKDLSLTTLLKNYSSKINKNKILHLDPDTKGFS